MMAIFIGFLSDTHDTHAYPHGLMGMLTHLHTHIPTHTLVCGYGYGYGHGKSCFYFLAGLLLQAWCWSYERRGEKENRLKFV